ncbi:mlo protein like protein 1 [Quercus suber]|uniref:MLO-like protein n=1 Tax=Quercus suber TaxID=58331 RepID=A0AAW0LY36_QUESU
MAAAAAGERSLKETPTWAVAFACAVFVITSILIEHGIHSLGKWLQKRQKKAMNEALEKIKAELMLLGIISLIITVSQIPISKICIPAKAGNIMLPCSKKGYTGSGGNRRKLLWYDEDVTWRRVLAATAGDDYCFKYGKVALVSQSGLHQLHIFIFVLAVFHVLYSVITLVLAKAKMKKWKAWEAETTSLEYQSTNEKEPHRGKEFINASLKCQADKYQEYLEALTPSRQEKDVAFFRQFVASVTKVDYLTMRHGFINVCIIQKAHLAPNSKFDFHKYIKRSMEDDFKDGSWYTLTWMSFMPLAILLLVGTKLEVIIMEMAQQIQDRTTVVKGAPVGKVALVSQSGLHQLHIFIFVLAVFHVLYSVITLVLAKAKVGFFRQFVASVTKVDYLTMRHGFINAHLALNSKFDFHKYIKRSMEDDFKYAFQMAYFLCIWYEFGLTSCFHEKWGSHMKKAIFEEQTAKAIKKWQKAARERKKLRKAGATDVSSSGFMSGENTPSHNSSPIHLLHKYKINSNDIETVLSSPKAYHSDTELSEIEGPARPSSSDDHETRRAETHHIYFSFVTP